MTIPIDNKIGQYVHCPDCLQDWKDAGSPEEMIEHNSIGYTKIGLQVWCEKHDQNVLHIDFDGHKFRVSTAQTPEDIKDVHR